MASLAQYHHGNNTHQSKSLYTSRAGPWGELASLAPALQPELLWVGKAAWPWPCFHQPSDLPVSFSHSSHSAQQHVGPGGVSSHRLPGSVPTPLHLPARPAHYTSGAVGSCSNPVDAPCGPRPREFNCCFNQTRSVQKSYTNASQSHFSQTKNYR